jgi:hypothetical protein
VYLHEFLTSALDAGEWSTSSPSNFITGVRTLASHWTGGSVGSRDGLDAAKRRNNPSPCPCRESKPDRSAAHSLITILTELPRILTFVHLLWVFLQWACDNSDDGAWVSIYLSIYLSICLSVCLSVYLSLCLPTYLPTFNEHNPS